jgi:exopolyphosphatase/guanosine-5'-triphosphate,3'-diphosphate pyrophosphatase
VPKGLKALLGLGSGGQRYAAIDVGTNSVKLHVAERGPDGGWQTVADRAEVTRLGEGLDEAGRLGEEAIRRTADAIAAMVAEARAAGAVEIAAVGTAGLRKAPNRDELLGLVRERCGLEIEVISGEEEARLAFAAAVGGLDLPDGTIVVFDTGGGSSQFTFGQDGRVDDQFSVEVGAARFTERFGLDRAVDESALSEARSAIATDLAFLGERPRPDALVGMGGAVTNLAAVAKELAEYEPEAVQGAVLEASEIDRQIELYRSRSADERREIVGLQPKRAEVILAGALIVRTVLEKLGRDSLVVSDRALRHGLLEERFG